MTSVLVVQCCNYFATSISQNDRLDSIALQTALCVTWHQETKKQDFDFRKISVAVNERILRQSWTNVALTKCCKLLGDAST